ncbi:transcription and mRNA export factor ENY2-like [Sarcophilus harrisii]|uniref:transcription and mRNA export factor ENY2-like n=1 Tax=Sarcophilus harrisii TaxID=9305 RepID=UPI00130205D4|nr:transcription and mRNA export factor ENY2-like [Sarcophilus harrisii]
MDTDAQMRAIILQKLIENGEGAQLQELLRAKLFECGWKDQIKAHCQDGIKEKEVEHVTAANLAAESLPEPERLYPTEELLQRIRTFLDRHASL